MPSPPPPQRQAATRRTLDKGAAQDKTWRHWAAGLFVLGLAAVLWGSLTPNPPTVDVSNADKVQHFAAYAGLAVLAFLALRRASLRAAVALMLFGVGVEVAQAATAQGREGSWLDAIANSAGILLIWLIGSRLRRRGAAKL